MLVALQRAGQGNEPEILKLRSLFFYPRFSGFKAELTFSPRSGSDKATMRLGYGTMKMGPLCLDWR
jgi:hypothetical protein